MRAIEDPLVVGLALRPRTESDETFLFSLYADIRDDVGTFGWSPDQLRAFLDLQYRARERSFALNHPSAQSDIVVVHGRAVGRLLVDRRADRIHLVDIALLGEQRDRGIGSQLLVTLQEEAALVGRPLCLQVRQGSPAIPLYLRLGFVPVGQFGEPDRFGEYLAMEYLTSECR
jgi:GNAT superfamily N-acetyltransferase